MAFIFELTIQKLIPILLDIQNVQLLLFKVVLLTIKILKVEGKIKASPAVYNDIMVIGTTGKGTEFVYGIRIR